MRVLSRYRELRPLGLAFLTVAAISLLPLEMSAQQPDASSPTNGAALLNSCRDLAQGRSDSSPAFLQGFCLGTVGAAFLLHNQTTFCVSQPLPKLQLVRIVSSYIERHPTKQSYELAVLASWALAEAYPCPAGRR